MKKKILKPYTIQISVVSKRFLDFLDRKKIQHLEDLEEKVGNNFQIPGSNDFIEVLRRPSNQNTVAVVADYVLARKAGVPLSIVLNRQLMYTQIILKSKIHVAGFQQFKPPLISEDIYGNKYQFQMIKGTNLENAKLILQGFAKSSGEYAYLFN